MSAFYGTVKGGRSAATRTGTKSSGCRASCQSWDGSVIVTMRYDSDGELKIGLEAADGSSAYGSEIFSGTMEELKKRLGSKA